MIFTIYGIALIGDEHITSSIGQMEAKRLYGRNKYPYNNPVDIHCYTQDT